MSPKLNGFPAGAHGRPAQCQSVAAGGGHEGGNEEGALLPAPATDQTPVKHTAAGPDQQGGKKMKTAPLKKGGKKRKTSPPLPKSTTDEAKASRSRRMAFLRKRRLENGLTLTGKRKRKRVMATGTQMATMAQIRHMACSHNQWK